MAKVRYLRTDEHEEAVRSLEWAEIQARSIPEDPYQWKWVLISLHSAVQGFMVLALWQGNGLLTLRDKTAAEWLAAYRNNGDFPADKLDTFLGLYYKVKDQTNFQSVGADAFIPSATHDTSLRCLNSLRNEFIHFTPKGWSLALVDLPRVCLDVLGIIEFFGWNSAAILWYKKTHAQRVKRAANKLRRSMLVLNRHYEVV